MTTLAFPTGWIATGQCLAVSQFGFMAPEGDRGASGSGEAPPASPPGSSGEGSQWRDSLRGVFRLFEEAKAAGRRGAPAAFAELVDIIGEGQGLLEQGGIAARTVNSLLDGAMQALDETVRNGLDRILPKDGLLIAAAFLVIGRMTLWNGEDVPRVKRLHKAAAGFSRAVEEQAGSKPSIQILNQDHYLATTIYELSGSLARGALEEGEKTALGKVLSRIGIAAVAATWPSRILDLPNIAGAVWEMFGYLKPEDLHPYATIRPDHLFQDAIPWRPGAMGHIEYILASLSEPSAFPRGDAAVWDAQNIFPLDPVLEELRLAINRLAPEEQLASLVSIAARPNSIVTYHDPFLPDFLKRAMEPVH